MDATGGNKRDDNKTNGIIDNNKEHDGQYEQQQLESSTSTSTSTSTSKMVEEQPNNNNNNNKTAAARIPLFEMDTEFGYQYRDFSNIPEKELIESQYQSSNIPVVPPRGTAESIRVQKFPLKLYAILAQNEFQDIIAWMPHGRSWKVHKPNLFETRIMPMFFEYSNYHSFNRLVNAWSFRRVSNGVDRGSYYHELFLRGKPYLHKFMRRLPKTHKKLPMKKQDEPDFYAMDKDNPLPFDSEADEDLIFSSGRNELMRMKQFRGTGIGGSGGGGNFLSAHDNSMGGVGAGVGLARMNGMNDFGEISSNINISRLVGMGSPMGPPGNAAAMALAMREWGGMNSMNNMMGGTGMDMNPMLRGGARTGMNGLGMNTMGMPSSSGMGGTGGINLIGMSSNPGMGYMNSMGATGIAAGGIMESGQLSEGMDLQRLRHLQHLHRLEQQIADRIMPGGRLGD